MYFVLISWEGSRVAKIQDFRYSRYMMDDADWSLYSRSAHALPSL